MSKALDIPATMDSSEVETIELISFVREEPETFTAVSSRYIQALDKKEQLGRELAETRDVLSRFICNVLFVGYAQEILLNGQNITICSGEMLTAVCIMNGKSSFVWSVPPYLTRQLSSSQVKNGTRIFGFISLFAENGQSSLTINNTRVLLIIGTVIISSYSDDNTITHNVTIEVLGKSHHWNNHWNNHC